MNIISDIVNDLVREHYNYISECEKQGTERTKKIAIITAKTKELQAYTDMAEAFFSHQLQERDRLFDSANKVLDKALENGDVDFAQIAIRTIEIVNRKSPFSY